MTNNIRLCGYLFPIPHSPFPIFTLFPLKLSYYNCIAAYDNHITIIVRAYFYYISF